MDATDFTIYAFIITLGVLVFVGIPAWFIIDIIKRRKQGLPVLDMGTPSSLIVLYQPDEVLQPRITVDALSEFLSAVQHSCLPILASSVRHPVDVVIGLKPGRKGRCWLVPTKPALETVKFQNAFDSLSFPDVTAPVAVALCIGCGAQHSPPLPEEWRSVLAARQGPTLIPDDVFQEIWNDDRRA